MWLTSCTCNDLIVSGLVCWPVEAGHCLHQLRGGTDVALRVELVQSFVFSTYLHMLVLFSIFIYLSCGLFIFIYSLLAL